MLLAGKGAFMKNIPQAEELAKEMIAIGKLANRETLCVLTNMNEPLGHSVGNTLEVIEAVNFLQGKMPEDLKQVVLTLGAYMLKLAGKGENIEENKLKLLENIQNGKAYQKFLQLVQNQGGDISYLEDTEKFEKAKYIEPILATRSGYIQEIDSKEVGKLASSLGAGRIKKEDKIDFSVGIVLNKKVADIVEKNDILAYIHANQKEKMEETKNRLLQIIKIADQEKKEEKVILEIMENVIK